MKKKLISLTLLFSISLLNANDINSSKLDEILKKLEESKQTQQINNPNVNLNQNGVTSEEQQQMKQQIQMLQQQLEQINLEKQQQMQQPAMPIDPNAEMTKIQAELNMEEIVSGKGKYEESNLLKRIDVLISKEELNKLSNVYIYEDKYTKFKKCVNEKCEIIVTIDENLVKKSISLYEDKILNVNKKIEELKNLKNIKPIKKMAEMLDTAEGSISNGMGAMTQQPMIQQDMSNPMSTTNIKYITLKNDSIYNGRTIKIEENYIEIK